MILSIEANAREHEHRWPPESTSSTVSRNASNLPLASGSSMYSGRIKPGCAQTWRKRVSAASTCTVAPSMPAAVDVRDHVAARGLGDAAIEPALQRREIALDDLFGALRQFARDVFFRAPQHERFEPRAQRARRLRRPRRSDSRSAAGTTLSEPSKPGSTKAKIDHRSRSEFSTGVPVSASRWSARSRARPWRSANSDSSHSAPRRGSACGS
jgi:hypothetical protein